MAKDSTTSRGENGDGVPDRPGNAGDRLAAVLGDIAEIDAGGEPPAREPKPKNENREQHARRKAREAEREEQDSAASRAAQRKLALKESERDDGDDDDDDDDDEDDVDEDFLLRDDTDEDDDAEEDDEDTDDTDEDDGDDDEEEDEDQRAASGKPAKQAAQPTDDSLHEVTLPGGVKQKVTYQELRAGYSREQDYTQKTQQVAEVRSQYVGLINQLVTFLEAAGDEPEPDWEKLAQEDPIGVANMRIDWKDRRDKRREQMAAAKAEQERTRTEEEEKTIARYNAHVAAEKAKLPELIPAWKDPKVMTAELRIINRELRETYGYSDDEIKQLSDARAIVVIRKAMMYDQIKRSGKDKRKPMRVKPQRTMRPGVRSHQPVGKTRRSKQVERAREALRKTGSDAAATAFFDSVLGD